MTLRLVDILVPPPRFKPSSSDIDRVAHFVFGREYGVQLFNGVRYMLPDMETLLQVIEGEAMASPQVMFTIRYGLPSTDRAAPNTPGRWRGDLLAIPERTLGRPWGRNIPKVLATIRWACLTREVLDAWPDLNDFQYEGE